MVFSKLITKTNNKTKQPRPKTLDKKMVKIVSDSFETLGGSAKAVSGQVKQVVKGIGDDIAESIGIKPVTAGTNEQGGQQQQQQKSDDQIKKMEAESKAKARKKYQQINSEIKQLQEKRQQEAVKYRQPGLTDKEKQENQIKQLEEKKEDKLPPLPVQRASKKTEALRGVSG